MTGTSAGFSRPHRDTHVSDSRRTQIIYLARINGPEQAGEEASKWEGRRHPSSLAQAILLRCVQRRDRTLVIQSQADVQVPWVLPRQTRRGIEGRSERAALHRRGRRYVQHPYSRWWGNEMQIMARRTSLHHPQAQVSGV